MNEPSTAQSSRLVRAAATLNPSYFAVVMATGIVSIGCQLWGLSWLSLPLLGLNVGAYAALALLTAARLSLFPRLLLADLVDHKRGVGFFTTVAATCVLGSQSLLVSDARSVAVILWFAGCALWLTLTYAIFTAFAVKAAKPALPDGIHGGWLVAVVAAQSVSVLGGLLAPGFGPYREQASFFALVMWLGGGMLYIWIISLIFYRYTFFTMSPADLSPPYWINMGAMAISTLAGTTLLSQANDSALLSQLVPFLKGLTLLFWATATWWIPMLVILGLWRHVYMRYPLAYDPQYWGGVFPLGMYSVCTFRLAHVMQAPFLSVISRSFLYLALAAWSLTFLGMVYSLVTAWIAGAAKQGRGA